LKEIRMVGGGARSDFWVQLAADIFGQAVCTTTARDASYGMALLAAVGAGVLSIHEAAEKIKIVKRFEPREPIARFYEKLYREVYHGHYDKSQREIDDAMNALMRSEEYREALSFWSKCEG
jgi:xylulokinase